MKLEKKSSVARTRQAVEETEANLDTAVRVADLAAKDSVVAIAAATDPDYDYYLMKVTSDGLVELDEPTTEDYGCTFPRGSFGLFFLRDNIIDMTYNIDKNKTAFVLLAQCSMFAGNYKSEEITFIKCL